MMKAMHGTNSKVYLDNKLEQATSSTGMTAL